MNDTNLATTETSVEEMYRGSILILQGGVYYLKMNAKHRERFRKCF